MMMMINSPAHHLRRVLSSSRIERGINTAYFHCNVLNQQRMHPPEESEIIIDKKAGGIGLHNVRERIIPTARKMDYELFAHTSEPRTVSIIGAPMTFGQPYVGTDTCPELLRSKGLRSMLSSLNWRVEDLPDLDFHTAIKNYKQQHKHSVGRPSSFTGKAKNHIEVGAGCQLLAETVYNKLQEGRFPLILGGDHSIGAGSLAGILKHRPDTGIIWVDAHADLNTPTISESGNMHGMPLGLLMEGGLQSEVLPGFEWLHGTTNYPRLPTTSLVYVGLRDVDQAERTLIRDLGIVAYTMTDIDRYGIGTVMDMAFQHLFNNNNTDRPIHLSYDIDSVDPVLAPATGTAVRGGLTFREAHYVAEAVAATGQLASAEIVELNPTLSDDGGANDTIELGLQLITSFMGKSII
jgi:arginase